MNESTKNVPEWLLSLFGDEIQAIESLRDEAIKYRALADHKDSLANEKQTAIAKAVREALGQPRQKQQDANSPLIPIPLGYPSKRQDQLIRFMEEGIITKCCQISEIRDALGKYETWASPKMNGVLDNLIYPMRDKELLASAKFNGNNKLVWWMLPSCIEQNGDKWRIKQDYIPKHPDIGTNPSYEVTYGKG